MTTDQANQPVPALLWDADMVAAALCISVDGAKYLHRMGELRGVKIGRHIRWRPEDVRDYVAQLEPTRGVR